MFQPTHPHGVRPITATSSKVNCMFQPTHPHGVRHRWTTQHNMRHCFNPRTRTGCDGAYSCHYGGSVRVSTHAPARGATPAAWTLS